LECLFIYLFTESMFGVSEASLNYGSIPFHVLAKGADTVSLASVDSADSGGRVESTSSTAVASKKETNVTIDTEANDSRSGFKLQDSERQIDLSIDISLLRNDEPIFDIVPDKPLSRKLLDQEQQMTTRVVDDSDVAAADDRNYELCSKNAAVTEPVEDKSDTVRSCELEDDFYSAYGSTSNRTRTQDPSELMNDAVENDAKKTVAICNEWNHSVDNIPEANDIALTDCISSLNNEPAQMNRTELSSSSSCKYSGCSSKDLLSDGMVIDMNLPPCSHVSGTLCYKMADRWVLLPAPANVQCLAVSARYVWCVDFTGRIFYSALHGPGLQWFSVAPVSAQQLRVSPSGALMWRLENGSVYAATGVTARRQPWGTKWLEVARDVSFISVDETVAWYAHVSFYLLR
jgi:hypothetical protein